MRCCCCASEAGPARALRAKVAFGRRYCITGGEHAFSTFELARWPGPQRPEGEQTRLGERS